MLKVATQVFKPNFISQARFGTLIAMTQNTQIISCGGGNMAQAMLTGMHQFTKVPSENFTILDPSAKKYQEVYKANVGDAVTASIDTKSLPKDYSTSKNMIVIAVKPHFVKDVCEMIEREKSKLSGDNTVVISVAAGIEHSTLKSWLPSFNNVVRTLPNTPMKEGQGACALYSDKLVGAWTEKALTDFLLPFTPCTVWLKNENHMSTATALIGSSPAYVYMFIETLTDWGVSQGLQREEARRMSTYMTLGTANTVARNPNQHLAALRDCVTSPGGTTIAGVIEAEKSGFRASLHKILQAVSDRVIALSAK